MKRKRDILMSEDLFAPYIILEPQTKRAREVFEKHRLAKENHGARIHIYRGEPMEIIEFASENRLKIDVEQSVMKRNKNLGLGRKFNAALEALNAGKKIPS